MIDIMISSCSRPRLLKVSINSFREKIISKKHSFRWVIIEDKVDDEKRKKLGRQFIKKNSNLFDEIIYLDKKAGVGFWWQEMLKHCKSKIHFHLEDDNKFLTNINIDPVIDLLENNKDIVEIILRRGKHNKKIKPIKTEVDNNKLTKINFMSIATGLFDTELSKRIVTEANGWNSKVHEFGTLTPASNKLKLRKFVLGHNKIHYEHIGKDNRYRKGKYYEK